MGTPAPGDPAAVAGPFEINPAHGMLVQCHHLRAALDAGEPRRACSALAIYLGYLGQRGAPAERRALALSGRVEALADRIGDPYVRGRATTMRGFLCFLLAGAGATPPCSPRRPHRPSAGPSKPAPTSRPWRCRRPPPPTIRSATSTS
jgi:hypothetical protein